MIDKTFDIIIDLVKSLQVPRVEFVRGDMKTCILNITLKNDDAQVNLTGLNVQFFFKKADSTIVTYDSRYDTTILIITDPANGILQCIMPLQALAAIGYGTGQVSIIDGNDAKATSQSFPIYVRDGWDSALVSMDEVPVLQKLISDVNAAQDQVDDSEVFRTNEENTREDNEASRLSNEATRQAAEIQRINNENSRQSAESTRQAGYSSMNSRISNLVVGAGGNSPIEVTDAHVSAIKQKTFATLDDRFEESEENAFEGIYPVNVIFQELLQNRREIQNNNAEIGTVTLTNSATFPFNNSQITVSLKQVRNTLDYTVITEATGTNIGDIIVSGKQLNGFKLEYNGSATNVTIKYYVRGGMK